MTEQKPIQLTREELEKKRLFWERSYLISTITALGLGIGSTIFSISYFNPKKTPEVVRYENAQQTYNWLQTQREEIESITTLPYSNETIQKFIDINVGADSTRVKALEDAIDSASEEMQVNADEYQSYISESGSKDKKSNLTILGSMFLPGIGLFYSLKKSIDYRNLLKQSEASKK